MVDGLADFHISVSIFIGIGPALLVLLCAKGAEPWTWGSLLAGCILVLIATLHLVHIPAHHEHPFRTNVNTYSGST